MNKKLNIEIERILLMIPSNYLDNNSYPRY